MQHYSNASLIFPATPLPQALSAPRLAADVLAQIHADPAVSASFHALSPQEQEAFLGFCTGNRGLKITLDPFFLRIFDPELHPERLERLLSCILGQEVKVVRLLPRERRRLSQDSSLVIMDILVLLSDGRLVDVEMQRIGYDFPIERGFCYGADLMVRQYDLAKEDRGSAFSYRDIKPIYIIVLMEQSPALFHRHPGQYIHRSLFSFDTGLKLASLQNFIYIPLDIFRQMPHNELTELEAWLYFLGSDDPADMMRIVEKYPAFRKLYQDIIDFRFRPKELIAMYSDALRIMDENTIKYMVDEMRAEMDSMTAKMDEMNAEMTKMNAEKDKMSAERDKVSAEKDKISAERDKISAERDKISAELSARNAALKAQQDENAELRARLAQYQKQNV